MLSVYIYFIPSSRSSDGFDIKYSVVVCSLYMSLSLHLFLCAHKKYKNRNSKKKIFFFFFFAMVVIDYCPAAATTTNDRSIITISYRRVNAIERGEQEKMTLRDGETSFIIFCCFVVYIFTQERHKNHARYIYISHF